MQICSELQVSAVYEGTIYKAGFYMFTVQFLGNMI